MAPEYPERLAVVVQVVCSFPAEGEIADCYLMVPPEAEELVQPDRLDCSLQLPSFCSIYPGSCWSANCSNLSVAAGTWDVHIRTLQRPRVAVDKGRGQMRAPEAGSDSLGRSGNILACTAVDTKQQAPTKRCLQTRLRSLAQVRGCKRTHTEDHCQTHTEDHSLARKQSRHRADW